MVKINSKNVELDFTGERLIPELNRGTAFYYEHLVRYLFASQFVNNKTVLDAGCGSGYGSFILAKYGKAKEVCAVDISQESIDYAKDKYFLKNIKFEKNNIEKLNAIKNKSIDVATSFEVIEHIENQGKFLFQIKRVLKKDGLFIVSTPNKYTYPKGNLFHTKELYPQEFFQLLKKYFKNVFFYHQNFEFTQLIKPENLKENFNLEEKFSSLPTQLFTKKVKPKNSQYIIAICTNGKLPETNLLSLTSDKIDSFDLTVGFFSLGKQFRELYDQINNLSQQITKKATESYDYKKQIQKISELLKQNQNLKNHVRKINIEKQNLETTLNTVKSAKFFKLWQTYCRIRDQIILKIKKLTP